ncbi:hypothetical protein [Mycolicibacterium grossiae]|uniref:hypothetical protein n=1 Tax=Mycolicibacterium grossiae TaxID=1552759 RepID=UPI00210C33E8|nr:hypothetical protein [Mycolicibacterium grossiae]
MVIADMPEEFLNGNTRFRSANDRIAQLVGDPLIADDVRQFAAERERVNEIRARGWRTAGRPPN